MKQSVLGVEPRMQESPHGDRHCERGAGIYHDMLGRLAETVTDMLTTLPYISNRSSWNYGSWLAGARHGRVCCSLHSMYEELCGFVACNDKSVCC